jgi:hypothetical protein
MIKFTVFLKTNTDILDVRVLYLPVKLPRDGPEDNFRGVVFKKRPGDLIIFGVTDRFTLIFQ